jgi:hypothetical protein
MRFLGDVHVQSQLADVVMGTRPAEGRINFCNRISGGQKYNRNLHVLFEVSLVKFMFSSFHLMSFLLICSVTGFH